MSIGLMWFRQDLRCQDNPAWALSCHQSQQLIPLYILDEDTQPLGSAQKWWLHHSLVSLSATLEEHGLDLCLCRGKAADILYALIQAFQVDTVYWNRCYEPLAIERDKIIKSQLKALGVHVISTNGALLNEPWTIHNKSGGFFKVFTPFWRHCLKELSIPVVEVIHQYPKLLSAPSESLSSWALLPKNPNWAIQFQQYWQPGEAGAQKKLDFFIKHHLQGYKHHRDIPALDNTSRLSAHLHFGEIGPRQICRALERIQMHKECDIASLETFLSEMGWREFSYYLLYHFPQLAQKNFKPEFDHFAWDTDASLLACWQRGQTGYPIIDAGMRELWHTGYMHNRVRMIVASFLCKDLLIDWRVGAEWFLDTLVDADLASNSASWQWVAGSGADAAPYFRIFNPVLQSQKFDPQGSYIRRWVPELSKVADKWIHQPWVASKADLGLSLGIDYPYPIVSHDIARKEALMRYDLIKK